ncbi:MAG: hypothetical protein Q7S29_02495 [Candidatus Peribacter sp.]|nr:hypothetical protein [Candidatus Peribacter sp.]
MPSLCIEPIPLAEALRNERGRNEEILETTRVAIAALHIADLQWGTAHALQCALWVRVPSEAMASLQQFLDEHDMRYEVFE